MAFDLPRLQTKTTDNFVSKNIFSSVLIVVSMRWVDRLLGLISTLILARLLVPDDFGVVAMASLFTGLVDIFLDLGVTAALIHKRHCDDDDYSTAWTIRLMQTTLAGIIIVASSPWVADYYNDSRVSAVLWVMAGTVFLGGLENIGIVSFQKEMQFGRDFQFFFLRRIVGFVVTLVLAWVLKSYWALPLGALTGRIFGVGLSYNLHAFRPHFTLSRFKNVWSISQWMLLRSIGGYLDSRLDKLLIGRRTDAATIGSYSLADEISAMPTSELLAPISRVLFPALVEVREQPEQLRRIFLLALSVQTLVALPAATGLALVAPEAVIVMLGERWLNAVPFLQVLALVYGISSVGHASAYLLMTLGQMRNMAIFIWLQFVLMALGAFTFLVDSGALALAQWRLIVTALGTLGFIILLLRLVESLKASDFLAAIWRPFSATGIMAAALTYAPSMELAPAPLLIVRCSAGALIYGLALLILWLIAGRPQTGEAYILNKLGLLREKR